MLLRVFLILAIVAGAATVAVTQFMVRPHVQGIITTRNEYETNWKSETKRANKLNKDLKDTTEKLTGTEKNLEQTTAKLAAAETQAADQQRRADSVQQKLDTANRDLTSARQDLAAWNALGIPVEQVAQTIQSERRFRDLNAALGAEMKVALDENKRLTNIIHQLRGGEEAPVVMPGVKGNVVAVDPKWNFVVLDVGDKQGAKERGVFMVSRNGKLVGKVKVASVLPDRSIANIVPGWQLDEIMEGDQVIF